MSKVWNVAKVGAAYLIPIVATIVLNRSNEIVDEMRFSRAVGYDDAVRAITKSGMWSSDKAAAIKLIKRDETPEYYKAIVSTVSSGMWSQDKLLTIKNLNVEEE